MDKRLISPEKMQEILNQVQEMDIPDLEKKSKQESLEILITLAMKGAAEAQLEKNLKQAPTPDLLTELEIEKAVAKYWFKKVAAKFLYVWTIKDAPEIAKEVAQAQLSHCRPLIEAEERRKIIKWIDENVLEQSENPTIFPRHKWHNFLASLKSGKPIEEVGE